MTKNFIIVLCIQFVNKYIILAIFESMYVLFELSFVYFLVINPFPRVEAVKKFEDGLLLLISLGPDIKHLKPKPSRLSTS